MKLAPSIKTLLAMVSLLVSASCSFLEPPPELPPVVSPVMVTVDPKNDDAATANVEEIVSYVRYLDGLPVESLRAELVKSEKELGPAPSLIQRVKLSFALLYAGTTVQQFEKGMSLIGDTSVLPKEQARLVTWMRHAKFALGRLELIAEREQKADRERKEVIKTNESLLRELSERKTEIARLEKQLSELKSIETSIIQRKAGEETTPP